jgi:hypothetical protein
MGRWRGTVAAVLVLACAGCAQQTGSSGTTDANGMIPSDHWTFSTFENKGKFSIAAIMASNKDGVINVICDPGGMYVSIDPKQPLPSVVGHRGLTLAFDGAPPVAQHWKTGTLKGNGFGSQDYFEVVAGNPEFQPMIDAFERHREVDVSITDSGTEVQHQTFTLDGAATAIDQVRAACKKSS